MPAPSQSLPTVGQPNSTEDPKSRATLLELQQILTQTLTGLDGDNLSTALAQRLGLSDSLATRRGKSIVAATESRSNTAYGLMPTPDRVQNIVLPTDGLIFVAYQATWRESVVGAAFAGLFIGATQARIAGGVTTGTIETDLSAGAAAIDRPLATSSALGLYGNQLGTGTSPYAGDVTTGQLVGLGNVSLAQGGPCVLFAAAGTYDISVQFKASSGSVTAKNRRLWVWTSSF